MATKKAKKTTKGLKKAKKLEAQKPLTVSRASLSDITITKTTDKTTPILF